MKVCPDCRRELPLSEFHKDSYGVKGVSVYCKPCKTKRIGKTKEKRREYYLEYRKAEYHRNKETYARNRRERHAKLRLEAMLSIQDPPICKWCGIEDVRVLAFDHINNDRSKDKSGPMMMYKRILALSKEERLKEFQILCHNCNILKEVKRRSLK